MFTIEESILTSTADLSTIFVTNNLDSVIALTETRIDQSLFHNSLKAKMCMLNAALTLDENDLNIAKQATQKCLIKCTKLRKRRFTKISNMLTKKHYEDLYTDTELQAEITYAMLTGCKAVLGLLSCYNMKKLAQIAYHIGVCVNINAKCRNIFDKRTAWESDLSKLHFEAAIRLEKGMRNLIVSFLPPKVLRIINFLGFNGIRDVAFHELNRTAFELPGVYSFIAQAVLIIYWLYIEMHACLGPKNLDFMQPYIDKKVIEHPFSALYQMAKSKLIQINGNLTSAIESYSSIIEKQNEFFPSVVNPSSEAMRAAIISISYWELMWIHALKCDWDKSIKYAEYLRKKTVHSQAIVTYLEAILRYQKGKIEGDQSLIDEASTLFEIVPTVRIRYFGKTMTMEKAVIVSSQRYFKNDKKIILPVFESLYNINYCYLFQNNKDLAQKWFDLIEKELKEFENNSIDRENYLVVLFYKGVLLKHMKKYEESLQCFNIIFNEEKNIIKEKFILPQTFMEIGLVKIEQGEKKEAKEYLEGAIKNYSKYVSENLVHIKSYAALRALGINTDKKAGEESEPLVDLDETDEFSENDELI